MKYLLQVLFLGLFCAARASGQVVIDKPAVPAEPDFETRKFVDFLTQLLAAPGGR